MQPPKSVSLASAEQAHQRASSGISAGLPAGEAVRRLVDRFGPRLHALALRMCGNAADAEDMVQEVFLQALRKWHTFRGDADPGTWLHAIAARSCKARLRRKGGVNRRVPAMSQLMPWAETSVMAVAAAAEDRADAAERNEAVARVQRAIAGLPEHLRVPLVLKEVLAMSVDDVAEALGLGVNTVKTRLFRARLALRKAMIAKAAAVAAPAPIYERQVCLDLLKAKMEAMNRGGTAGGFKVPQAELCARCRAVFRELDLVQDACAQLGMGRMSAAVRAKLLRAIAAREQKERERTSKSRPGRRPVRGRTGDR